MSGSETVATPAEIADRVDERQQRLSRARTLWLTVGAAGGAFALSAGLSALFATDTRLLLGEWIALVLFAAAAAPLAFLDATTRRLPNRGTFPLAGGMLGYWTGLALTTGQWQLLTQAVVCALGLTIILSAIATFGSLAFGDVKLAIAIALLTGWFSWLLPLYAIAAGYLLAVPHAAVLIVRRRRDPGADNRIPFGPYLVAGAVLVTFLALLTR